MEITREELMLFTDRIMDKLELIENGIKQILESRNVLDGETLVSTRDLCRMLDLNERTLFNYREKGILHGIVIERKIYYRMSEIKALMKRIIEQQTNL